MELHKPFTIEVEESGGWWVAICPQLMVSGMGATKRAALAHCVMAMSSTLGAVATMLRRDQDMVAKVAVIKQKL